MPGSIPRGAFRQFGTDLVTALEWFGDGFGMVWALFWDGLGMFWL